MRRRFWGTALAVITATTLGIAGCSSADVGGQSEVNQSAGGQSADGPAVNRDPDFPLPEVKGAWGEIPEIVPIADEPPTEITAKLITPGDGQEVQAGGMVTAYYTGFLWDGKSFDSSFNYGEAPSTFDLNRVVDGWKYGLVGTRVGDRVLLVVPPEYGYGSTPQGSIPADSTLVFVVDIVDVPGADLSALKDATLTNEPLPKGLLVEGALGESPVIGFEEGAVAPTEPVETILAEGTGPVVTAENSVVYHYSGLYWGTPGSVDTTWSSGPTVIPAADTIFLGHNVGSRLLLIFPAASESEPANVMVVDIVAAY